MDLTDAAQRTLRTHDTAKVSHRRLAVVALTTGLALFGSSGCASLMRSASGELAGHLRGAVLDHDDVATVREAAPSFLVLLDALIGADPESVDLLLAASNLYARFAAGFVADPERALRLSQRALGYGERALCSHDPRLCQLASQPFDAFAAALATSKERDVAALYGFGVSWATWISLRTDDWNALAELPKLEALMARVVELDDDFDDGGAHLVLGVLKTQRPAELGGKPEEGHIHFRRALALSRDRNLMVKVLIARHYARLIFDRELHDRLLNEVLSADVHAQGFTLSNTLAQSEAHALLENADEYF